MPDAIPYPAPNSMRVADAAKWFRASVPLIPGTLVSPGHAVDRFIEAWNTKSRLRLAAALALWDQELVAEFLTTFPMPPIDAMLEEAAAEVGTDTDPLAERATAMLLGFTLEQQRAFPGTVGESIGMELWDGKQDWVMTEEGWRLKE